MGIGVLLRYVVFSYLFGDGRFSITVLWMVWNYRRGALI